MTDVEGLRAFCLDLSTDKPSPGGGAAAAAAGAMAASLLIMVCGVTSRSKKHAQDLPRLARLKSELLSIRDELVELARLDAEAYDAVADASRRLRGDDSDDNKQGFQNSLRKAVEIPARTANRCLAVIERSVEVASLQIANASSDTFVAVSLARAAYEGAFANVEINLHDMTDEDFVEGKRTEIRAKKAEGASMAQAALAALERRQRG